MLFVVALISLSIILNETNLRYVTSQNPKFNHFLFMEHLKLYAKSERELDSLTQTMRIFSDDVVMVMMMLDSIMNKEIKKKVKSEYFRGAKKFLRSQVNGGNVIAGMNAWEVGIIRYGAGVLGWMKEELKNIDIKTRKLMTMNGSLHPRENVGRLYFARNKLRRMRQCGSAELGQVS